MDVDSSRTLNTSYSRSDTVTNSVYEDGMPPPGPVMFKSNISLMSNWSNQSGRSVMRQSPALSTAGPGALLGDEYTAINAIRDNLNQKNDSKSKVILPPRLTRLITEQSRLSETPAASTAYQTFILYGPGSPMGLDKSPFLVLDQKHSNKKSTKCQTPSVAYFTNLEIPKLSDFQTIFTVGIFIC